MAQEPDVRRHEDDDEQEGHQQALDQLQPLAAIGQDLGATGVTASVRCDALMLDDESRSDTYPYIDIQEDDTTMTHEATVGKISADQVFYLMSRGLSENEAQNLVVQGFLNDQSHPGAQFQLLQEAGVATLSGTGFGQYGEGYVRLSYANSMANLELALERIRDFVSGL